jgi:hypothetical protein
MIDCFQQTGRFPGLHATLQNSNILTALLLQHMGRKTAATAAATNENKLFVLRYFGYVGKQRRQRL